MNLKSFRYENGMCIIAPLKHGTRWLEQKTNPIGIEDFYFQNGIGGITNKTYWVYREPKEHMVSALRTEIRSGIEYGDGSVESIVDGFINGMGIHWSTELYKYAYRYWNNMEFNLIHLKDLSNLFVGVKYDSKHYDMGNFVKAKHTTEDIIDLVGSTKMNELYRLCDEDELWLKRILNNERGLTSYDLLIQKQQTINELNKTISVITNNSKLVQEQLKNDILNLKTKLKLIKKELI